MNQGLQLPHDIEGLLGYSFPWGLLIGVIVLSVVITLLVIWLIKRWRMRGQLPQQLPQIDPLKEALAALAKLKTPDPLTQLAANDFCYQASLYFRQVLEYTSKIPATDMTLGELKRTLRAKSLGAQIDSDEMLRSLEKADFVKFAERSFTPKDAEQLQGYLLNCARQLADWRENCLAEEKNITKNIVQNQNKQPSMTGPNGGVS